MRKNISRLIGIVMALLLATLFAFNSLADTKSELNEANGLKAELEEQKAESEARLNELKESAADIEERLNEINAEIEEIEALIEEYEAEEAELEAQIEELMEQIDAEEAEVARRYSKMKLRIQYMYENVGDDFIDAIFSSSSIGELFKKLQYILDINDYDHEMMNQLEELITVLEADKEDLQSDLEDVDALKIAQEDQKEVLEELYETKYEELKAIEAEAAEEASEIEAINADLAANAAQIEELSAKYDEELAEARAAAAASSGGSESSGGSSSYYENSLTTGSWIWPLDGYTYVSSGFGPRSGGYHYGIDIPAPTGTPVKAVDGGVVVIARITPTYDTGNYIVIYHGDQIYSEYMHLSEIYVSAGNSVSQGQYIGAVGSTGQSTGPHLHLSKGIGSTYWLNRVAPF